jgi:hypothetical protein
MEVNDQFHDSATSPLGKAPQCPFNRWLGGSHSQSECFREQKNLLLQLGIKLHFLSCSTYSLLMLQTWPDAINYNYELSLRQPPQKGGGGLFALITPYLNLAAAINT